MLRTTIPALALLLAMATHAHAQDYRYGAGFYGGAVWISPLNPGAGAVEGAGARDLSFDPGWVAGLQIEQWWGSGRVGGRLGGALTQRPLDAPGLRRDIGIVLADASFLLRVAPATADRRVNAHLVAGLGVAHYKLGRGADLDFVPADARYPGRGDARFAGVGGLGIDILTGLRWGGEPVGIRLEGTDHVALESPFLRSAGGRYGAVHNVRVSLGIHTGFGVLR